MSWGCGFGSGTLDYSDGDIDDVYDDYEYSDCNIDEIQDCIDYGYNAINKNKIKETPKMNLQEKLKQGARQAAPRIVLYGIPGIGKSTFASTAPKPVFIPTEDGLSALKNTPQFPVAKNIDEFNTNLDMLINEKHDFKTVIIDTADWLESLLCEDILASAKGMCMANACGGYGAAWGVLKNQFRAILSKMNYFRDNGIMVIFVAHSSVQTITTPETGSFEQFSLKLNHGTNKSPGGTAALLSEWADAMFFLTRENGAVNGDEIGGARILRCSTTPNAEAKNRWRMPELLVGEDINWKTILSYYSQNSQFKKEANNG